LSFETTFLKSALQHQRVALPASQPAWLCAAGWVSNVSAYGTNQRDYLREDFCLIFVPFGHCDEPEILPYASSLICSIGADVRQSEAALDAEYGEFG
jgi:hypothetical protein